MYLCYIITEGFRFMPLSLVRLRTFRLSTWVSWSNIEAGVNVGARRRIKVSLRCHNNQRRNTVTGCEWCHAQEARGGLCENLKSQGRVLDAKREGSTFGARRREANLRPLGPLELGAKWIRQHVETINSKLIKRFRTWTRSRNVFSNSEIPMFYRNQHSMSISPISHMAIFVYMAM